MTRDEFIAHAIGSDMFGLEVGPSYSPTLPKAAGYNVETLDHASADDIRLKYAAMGIDTSGIETVDYVSDGRPIHEIIPRRGEYDFVLASHVIEHLTDPIGFIESCRILLKPAGSLVLIIPDKRKSFDALQQATTTGDVLRAHLNKATRHDAGSAFDFMSNCCTLNGSGIWEDQNTGTITLNNTLDQSIQVFNEVAQPEAPYFDIHAWRFTPSSLRLIVQNLSDAGVIGMRESGLYPAHNFEFYMTLAVTGAGSGLTSQEILRSSIREQAESWLQIVDANVW